MSEAKTGMSYEERDAIVDRICSPFQSIPHGDKWLLLKYPTATQKQVGHILHQRYYDDCIESNVATRVEIKEWMRSKEMWTEEDDKKREDLTKNMETLKTELFNNFFKQSIAEKARDYLAKTRGMLEELNEKEFAFDRFTAEYVSASSRICFLTAANLYLPDQFMQPAHHLLDADHYVDDIMGFVISNRPTETVLRELSRTDPWRSLWMCSDKINLFAGIHLNEISVEMRSLITWSKFYDNVYQSQECPCDDIVYDDDALDGWCIINRRKRESESNARTVTDGIKNSKIKNSQEIFVMAKSWDDVKRIEAMNDTAGKIIKKQRANALKEAGEINEMNMPDTRQRFNEAVVENNRKGAGRARGRRR